MLTRRPETVWNKCVFQICNLWQNEQKDYWLHFANCFNQHYWDLWASWDWVRRWTNNSGLVSWLWILISLLPHSNEFGKLKNPLLVIWLAHKCNYWDWVIVRAVFVSEPMLEELLSSFADSFKHFLHMIRRPTFCSLSSTVFVIFP